MTPPLRIAILVTHLLGVGHLARASALACAMAARGHRVRLVSGGQPAPLAAPDGPAAQAGVEIVQLPPLHVAGAAFLDLREADGSPLGEATAQARIDMAVKAVRDFAPHALVTELFPFGRRMLAREFLAVIEAARALAQPPLMLASVRDILARPSNQAKIDAAHALLREHYDGVLVHSDPALVRLEASWPLAPDLQPLLHYTGYVDAPHATTPAPDGSRAGVIVSGGGSEAGLPLLHVALQAAALDGGRPWRLLAGHKISQEAFAALQAATPANAILERARPDFRNLLAACAVSVSQFGYNTALDLLATGAPAVVVPFAEGGETEQGERAALFASRGRVTALAQDKLTPQNLLAAVNAAASRALPETMTAINVDGAPRTARIIEMLAQRRAPALMRLAGPIRAALQPVTAALAQAGDQDAPAAFWWRDDDAVAPTPQLERLLRCASAHGAPLAIAAIPAQASPELAARLASEPAVVLLPHGLSHDNLAPKAAKKAELSHGDAQAVAARAADGLRLLQRLAPAQTRAVLVPPWNRITPNAMPLLAAAGFRGLSTFTERRQREAAPGLVQVNTHIDPANWRDGRSLADPQMLAQALVAAIGRRATPAEAARLGAIGLLTHHLIHDEAIDAWTHELAAVIAASAGARFVSIDEEIAG